MTPTYTFTYTYNMPQVTLYMDEETDAKARAAAEAAGVSYSRWVADLIRSRTRNEWPALIRNLAGSFPEFPARAVEPESIDVVRVPLD